MSDLQDILAKKRLPREPAEFAVIRKFIQDNFSVTPRLQLRDTSIVIAMPGSAAAGSLRFRLPELETKLESDYKLVITSV